MANQVKKEIKEAKDNFKQNPREVYFKFFSLAEQALIFCAKSIGNLWSTDIEDTKPGMQASDLQVWYRYSPPNKNKYWLQAKLNTARKAK